MTGVPFRVPERLIADPAFRRACAGWQAGVIFSMAMRACGLTLTRTGRLCGLYPSRVSDYMLGRHTLKNRDVVTRIADGLGIPGHLLGLAPRPWESAAEKPGPAAAPPSETGGTPQPGKHGSPDLDDDEPEIMGIIDWLAVSNTSDETVEQLEQATQSLAKAHTQVPAHRMLPGAPRLHRQTQSLLKSGRQRWRQTRELLRIDSRLPAHAALLLGDLHDDHMAEAYGRAAFLYAREADLDQSIVWGVQSKTARWQNKYVEAADLVRRGFESSSDSPVRLQLAYYEANAAALLGDVNRARQALP